MAESLLDLYNAGLFDEEDKQKDQSAVDDVIEDLQETPDPVEIKDDTVSAVDVETPVEQPVPQSESIDLPLSPKVLGEMSLLDIPDSYFETDTEFLEPILPDDDVEPEGNHSVFDMLVDSYPRAIQSKMATNSLEAYDLAFSEESGRSLADMEYYSVGNPNVPGLGEMLEFEDRYQNPEEYKKRKLADGEHYAKLSAEYGAMGSGATYSPGVQKFFQSEGAKESFMAFLDNPIDVITEVSAMSGFSMAESIVGGLMGAPLGLPGVVAGTGLASANVEQAFSIMDGLQKAGVDITEESEVAEFLSDSDNIQDLYNHANTRAGIIGSFDAATMGVASKFLTPGSTLAQKIAGAQAPYGAKLVDNLTAQTAVQMVGGGGGEAVAQIATEGEITSYPEVFAEGFAEGITAPVDVAVAGYAYTKNKDIANAKFYMDSDGSIRVTNGKIPEGGKSLNDDEIPPGVVVVDEDGKPTTFIPIEDTVTSDYDTQTDTDTAQDPVVEEEPVIEEDPVEDPVEEPVTPSKPLPEGIDPANIQVKTNRGKTDQGYPITTFSIGENNKVQYVKIPSATGTTSGTYYLRSMMGDYINVETGKPTNVMEEANTGETTLKNLKQKLIDDFKAEYGITDEAVTPVTETPVTEPVVEDKPTQDPNIAVEEYNSKAYQDATSKAYDLSELGFFTPEELASRANITVADAKKYLKMMEFEGVINVDDTGNKYGFPESDDFVDEGATLDNPVLDDILDQDSGIDNPLLDDQTDDSIYEDKKPIAVKFKTEGKIEIELPDGSTKNVDSYSIMYNGQPSGYAYRKMTKKEGLEYGYDRPVFIVFDVNDPRAEPVNEQLFASEAKSLKDEISSFAQDGLSIQEVYGFGDIPEFSIRPQLSERPTARTVRDDLIDAGYNVDQPLYHWTNKQFLSIKASIEGKMGAGVYLSPNAEYGKRYVDMSDGTARRVTLFAKGKIATQQDQIAADAKVRKDNPGIDVTMDMINAQLKKDGFSGVKGAGTLRNEILIFNERDVIEVETAGSTFGRSDKQKADAEQIKQTIDNSHKDPEIQKVFGGFSPAWNYVSVVEDVRARAGIKRPAYGPDQVITYGQRKDKPKRRTDIIAPLLKALGVPIFNGSINNSIRGGKNVMGYYIPGKDTIRIRNANDMETIAHEIAHLIDYKNPEIGKFYRSGQFPAEMEALVYSAYQQKLDAYFAEQNPNFVGPMPLLGPTEEVKGVSYTTNPKLIESEGFAEFHRLFLTQPEKAREMTPNIYTWYDNWLKGSPYGKAIKKAQKEMVAWYNQDPAQTFRSKIGGERPANSKLTRKGLRQATVDDLQGIKNAVIELTQRGELQLSEINSYMIARLTRSSSAFVAGALSYGAPRWKKDSKGNVQFDFDGAESLVDIIQFARYNPNVKGDFLEVFYDYMYARSARELQQQGRENLWTREEVSRILEDVPKMHPHMPEAFDRYQVWNKAIVKFAVDGGLLSQEQVDKWQRVEYMPMYRINPTGVAPLAKRMRALDNASPGIKRLFGSSRNVRPAGENIITNANMLLTQTLVNHAKREAVNEIRRSSAAGIFVEKSIAETKGDTIATVEIQRLVKEIMGELTLEEDVRDVVEEELFFAFQDMPDYFQFWRFGQHKKGGDILHVMNNGKPVVYQVNKQDGGPGAQLYDSLAALNRPARNDFYRLMKGSTRVFQNTITLGFKFLTKSLVRETIQGALLSQNNQVPIINTLRGIKSAMTEDAVYRDFIANGGGYSGFVNSDAALESATRKITQRGAIQTIIGSPKAAYLAWNKLASAIELAEKITEYRLGVEAGRPKAEAAYYAREMGGDFAMQGNHTLMNYYAATVPFLQPALTGADGFFRKFSKDESPNRSVIIGRITGLAFVAAGVAYMTIKHNREEWDELKDHEKLMYFNMPFTNDEGNKEIIRIPKPYEIGIITRFAEQLVELGFMMHENGDPDYSDWLSDAVENLFTVGTSIPTTPLALDVFNEYFSGVDTFTGKDIENFSLDRLTPGARKTRDGSVFLSQLAEKSIGSPLEFSAPKVEAFFESLFNGAAGTTMALLDEAVLYADDELPRPVGSRSALYEEIKKTNWWKTEGATSGGRRVTNSVGEFYETLAELQETRANIMAFGRQYNEKAMAKQMEKFQELGGPFAYDTFVQTNRALTNINKALDLNRFHPTMTGEEKQEKQDELYQMRNDLLKDVVDAYEKSLQFQKVVEMQESLDPRGNEGG